MRSMRSAPMRSALRAPMSRQDFAAVGIGMVAYVRPALRQGTVIYSVYAADGTLLTVASDRASALEAARDQDLEPLMLH